MLRIALSAPLLGSAILLLAACAGEDEPLVNQGAPGSPKAAESIARESAPIDRSVDLSATLNQYRAEAYSVLTPQTRNVSHNNTLYTAALRHAKYLDGLNSVEYNPLGADIGEPVDNITTDTEYVELREETIVPEAGATFPALFTNNSIYSRVAAVVGSTGLIDACKRQGFNEFYVFNGDLPTESEGNSPFRGYGSSSFNAVEHLWYSRRGRATLMRPNLTAIGFGSTADDYQDDCRCSPWPIFDGNFLGALTTASVQPAVYQLSIWPNNGNQNVNTYGLDTDLEEVSTPPEGVDVVVRHGFSGPPIHITLPSSQPFLLNTDIAAGGIQVGFHKMMVDPTNPAIEQNPPHAGILRYITGFWRGANGSIASILFDPDVDEEYRYTPVGFEETDVPPADLLRNGELILIPTEPLEPNSWYEVMVRLRTTSYVFPQPPAGEEPNDTQIYRWHFKTNGTTPL